MTIKEVEKKLNITRANIRFYEKEGLLEPKRCDNEYRDYSEDDLKRLEKILLFRKCNISIENLLLIHLILISILISWIAKNKKVIDFMI